MYSQGQEEKYILEYFANLSTGTVLDIGANDGITFSNSLALIERGWRGVLVEPSKTCIAQLKELHQHNNVIIVGAAISNEDGKKTFYESGNLPDPALRGKENHSLVSTLYATEKKRWERLNMQWNENEIDTVTFKSFLNLVPDKTFDFITIDAEGLDLTILLQIDLAAVGCQLLCIEYNEDQVHKQFIIDNCAQFGLTNIIHVNAENILIGK